MKTWSCVKFFKLKISTITDALEVFKSRGLVKQILPPISDNVYSYPINIYTGIDPTASSLHIGNLLIIVSLMRWQILGHNAHVLIGKSTTQIGDPSGKDIERKDLPENVIDHNIKQIKLSLQKIYCNFNKIFPYQLKYPKFHINEEWYKGFNIIEFIAKYGRCFRIGTMIRKEYIRSRINSPNGISFKEFSYQIFQAYDWLYLFENENCQFQLGGSDQMGNMEAGYELIKKLTLKIAHCITLPLVLSRKGEKLSKSVGNVIWLDPLKTSPFDFYQHFVRLPDDEVEKYLKYYTFLGLPIIYELMEQSQKDPGKRIAHRELANHLTQLVHGPEMLDLCQKTTQLVYRSPKNKVSLTDQIPEHSIATIQDGAFWDLTTNRSNVSIISRTIGFDLSLRTDNNLDCQDSEIFANPKKSICLDSDTIKDLNVGDLLSHLLPHEHFRTLDDVISLIQNKAVRLNKIVINSIDQNFDFENMVHPVSNMNDNSQHYITILKIGKRNYRLIHWRLPSLLHTHKIQTSL